MNKAELLQKCKELSIKGVSNKNKDELIEIINKHLAKPGPKPFDIVLSELNKITIKTRKVCKSCGDIGHYSSSNDCKYNIYNNLILSNKIKRYFLNIDVFQDIDEHFKLLADSLSISEYMCKSIYSEIPQEELMHRPMNFTSYLSNCIETSPKCYQCSKSLLATNPKKWKGEVLCDACWYAYENEREAVWKTINEKVDYTCCICSYKKSCPVDRFHFDHLNMFDKSNSVMSMVSDGMTFDDIWAEISKCQVICISCHSIITDIEHKLGFTRIKQNLTRMKNNDEISDEVYAETIIKYQSIYENKMKSVYKELKHFW